MRYEPDPNEPQSSEEYLTILRLVQSLPAAELDDLARVILLLQPADDAALAKKMTY